MRPIMTRKHELRLNLTDAKIWAVIRYLDPDTKGLSNEKEPCLFAVYASIVMFVLGYAGFVLLCRRIA